MNDKENEKAEDEEKEKKSAGDGWNTSKKRTRTKNSSRATQARQTIQVRGKHMTSRRSWRRRKMKKRRMMRERSGYGHGERAAWTAARDDPLYVYKSQSWLKSEATATCSRRLPNIQIIIVFMKFSSSSVTVC